MPETKLRKYKGAGRFEADRGLMEAQGWRVVSVETREERARWFPRPELPRDHEPRRQPAWDETDVRLAVIHEYSGAARVELIGKLVVQLVVGLGLLVAAPFVWVWSRWRAGRWVDVTYQR